MKRFLLLTILLCGVLANSNAQKREDNIIIKFDSVSQSLPNVKRWMLMPGTGKWDSTGKTHAFTRWASFKYKDQTYYTFLYEKVTGYYKYPTIKEDWINIYSTAYSVFTANQYQEIISKLAQKTGKKLLFKCSNNGTVSIAENTKGDAMLTDELYKSITDMMGESRLFKINQVFALNSQVIDGKSIVRFSNPSDPENTGYMLKDNYYELPYDDFMNAMKMK